MVGADDLDRRLGVWAAVRVGQVDGRRLIAIDGKSIRGDVVNGVRSHLLSALTHCGGLVVGQLPVPDRASEIPALKDLLTPMDLTGVVVTADALHCQRDTAAWLTERG